MTALDHSLRSVLRHLPSVQYAFAYGSGVLTQPGLYPTTSSQGEDDAQGGTSARASADASRGSQDGGSAPMLDFMLAVDDPVSWHRQNIQSNPSHYSWVGSLGAETVVGIASHVGVGVHFNPLVQIDGKMVKYGVLSTADLMDDLASWRRLYVAGRLHKPVATLVPHEGIEELVAHNLRSAALTALLLLPTRFTTEDLLRQVVGLSYNGDIRMGWAEDPHKVARIVAGSLQPLQDMYLPLISPQEQPAVPSPNQATLPNQAPSPAGSEAGTTPSSDTASTSSAVASTGDNALGASVALTGNGALGGSSGTSVLTPGQIAGVQRVSEHTWQQSHGPEVACEMVARLPSAVLVQVAAQAGFLVPESHCQAGSSTALELAHAVVKTNKHQQIVRSVLHATVRSSSLWQAASGVLSAGGGKAVAYVAAKLTKAFHATAPRLKAIRAARKAKDH